MLEDSVVENTPPGEFNLVNKSYSQIIRAMSSILKKLALSTYKNCVMQSRRNFLGFTKSYQRTLEKRPYLVQAVQAGIIMGAGDLFAQICFAPNKTVTIDYIRTLQFFSIGFGFVVRNKILLNETKTLTKFIFRDHPFASGMEYWIERWKPNHRWRKLWSKCSSIR